jgi:hypothetical protein
VTADLIEGYLDQLITHLRCSATDVWNDCENDHLTVLGAWLTVVAMLERRRSASEYRCMNAVARRPAIQQERERRKPAGCPLPSCSPSACAKPRSPTSLACPARR